MSPLVASIVLFMAVPGSRISGCSEPDVRPPLVILAPRESHQLSINQPSASIDEIRKIANRARYEVIADHGATFLIKNTLFGIDKARARAEMILELAMVVRSGDKVLSESKLTPSARTSLQTLAAHYFPPKHKDMVGNSPLVFRVIPMAELEFAGNGRSHTSLCDLMRQAPIPGELVMNPISSSAPRGQAVTVEPADLQAVSIVVVGHAPLKRRLQLMQEAVLRLEELIEARTSEFDAAAAALREAIEGSTTTPGAKLPKAGDDAHSLDFALAKQITGSVIAGAKNLGFRDYADFQQFWSSAKVVRAQPHLMLQFAIDGGSNGRVVFGFPLSSGIQQ